MLENRASKGADMKRLAILLAGIMLAAAGLVIAPATALADDLEVEILSAETIEVTGAGDTYQIQVKVTNTTDFDIFRFVWHCTTPGDGKSDSPNTTISSGETITIPLTLQVGESEVSSGSSCIDFDAYGYDGGDNKKHTYVRKDILITVVKPPLTAEILTKEAQVTYSGGEFTFDVQVKVTNNTGAPIKDFEWDCGGAQSDDKTTLGTDGATLTITLQASKEVFGNGVRVEFDAYGYGIDDEGGFTQSIQAWARKDVDLVPVTIADGDVTLSWTETVYSGMPRVPAVTVTHGGTTLTPSEDYSVSLEGPSADGTAVGDYYLYIEGENAFQGTVSKKFTIKLPLTVEITTEKVEVTAGGESCTIELKITNNTGSNLYDCTFLHGVDGNDEPDTIRTLPFDATTVTFSFRVTAEQIAAGKVSVSASADAEDVDHNHFSSGTVSRDIPVILLKPIADCTVTLSEYTYGYDGNSQVPTVVSVKDGDATLTEGEDYEVKLYHDGQVVESAVDAGDYKVRIVGKGRYSGSVDKGFTIDPRPVTSLEIEVVYPVEYAGSPVTPEVTVKDGENVLTEGKDYKLSCVNNDGPGTGILIVNGQGNYTGEVKKPFIINAPAPTYSLTVEIAFQGVTADLQFGDRITWMATAENTGTGNVDFVLTFGLDPDNPWTVSDLVAGEERHYSSRPYEVTYADVVAGMITTAGSVTATGPNGEVVTVTITDATAKVVPTPTTFILDLGEGTLDGKTGKVTIDANVGQPYQLPTGKPIRDGYTFQFYKGSEYYPGDTYIVEAGHTLTAVYKKNQPTIPPTGDATPLALALALLVLSGAGLAFARKRG